MYFPYLRGKQHELLMLRTLAQKLGKSQEVIPILEPVTDRASGLRRTLEALREENVPHIVLRNPLVGSIDAPEDFLEAVGESEGATIDGLCIGPQTTSTEIRAFVREHGTRPTALIHWTEYSSPTDLKSYLDRADDFQWHVFIENKTSTAYRDQFKNSQRCLVGDGFKPEIRNKDYCSDEIFSDLNLQYRRRGYEAFGDFLMVGEKFRDSGGPAHAVCIHLTYLRQSKDIGIRHFVSDTTTIPPADTAGKFLEALAKLIRFIDRDRPAFAYSTACDSYRALFRSRHFPQLGKVKELSMQHHVELMIEIV